MSLHNWFLPHKDTHKKAHLISWEAIFIYILFFIFLQVGFSIVGYSKPGILGISSNIDQKKLIELTNQERQKNGLSLLVENEALNNAARMKAQNMFEENYWAHFAPSGKTPWDFILGAGYKFTYAGENLAKNFYESPQVVSAWMASPTHKDNVLSSKYSDVGIAVVDGVINGEKTTLVVQMFGTGSKMSEQATKPSVTVSGKEHKVEKEEYENVPALIASEKTSPNLVASIQTPTIAKPLLDPYKISRFLGIGLISILVILLFIDVLILRRRGVLRLTSHHFAHMALLSIAAASILSSRSGSIL